MDTEHFPKKLDDEDMKLFRKECRLAGIDVEYDPGWEYGSRVWIWSTRRPRPKILTHYELFKGVWKRI